MRPQSGSFMCFTESKISQFKGDGLCENTWPFGCFHLINHKEISYISFLSPTEVTTATDHISGQ